MLSQASETQSIKEAKRTSARTIRRERRLWDQPRLTPPLGCAVCQQFKECGGLRTASPILDCMDLCCGQPEVCTKVCRAKPKDFVDRVREVDGFDLTTVKKAPALQAPTLPSMVPVVYHGKKRSRRYPGGAVALSLYALLNKRTGDLKFSSREELCEAFKIASNSTIVLTGTDQDPPLERWWSYGEAKTDEIIRGLVGLGVALVSTPNYSLFANVPRWDDLHSMKRIAITFAQFIRGGLPAALHVNGRTADDFRRWAAFLQERPEVTHLAYEFGTGAGRAGRSSQHKDWLISLARSVDRPIYIVVRGGLDIVPSLAEAFASVTILDTSAFMKTMNRQRAQADGNIRVKWNSSPTSTTEELEALFEHNVAVLGDVSTLLTAHLGDARLAAVA